GPLDPNTRSVVHRPGRLVHTRGSRSPCPWWGSGTSPSRSPL
ncbi:MAG: hypothetical protein AVDCRST_MAG70-2489, partial [uncultured Thermomicrobiales bacterium]